MNAFFRSIRWRLLAWYGLVLLVVLVAFGYTAYWLVVGNRLRRIDQELDQRLSILTEALRPGPRRGGAPPGRAGGIRPGERNGPPWRGGRSDLERPVPVFPSELRLNPTQTSFFATQGEASFYYVLWLPDGTRFQNSSAAPEDVPMPRSYRSANLRRVRTRGEMREVALVNPRGMRMVVGRSITTDLADLRRLAWWLALAGVGVLLLGMGGGWWIATRAIGPIADISFTAQKIAAGRLSQRIESKDTDSELGQLAQVLNATFDRLQAALDRQTQFTADASHELRTPVAVLLSQTQTALSRVRSEPDYREALEVCQRTAQRMRRVIESLLTLARLDSGEAAVTRESCALDRITRQALRLLEPLATEQGVAIRIEADPVHCFGDGHLLEQLVTNLVGNALVYNQRDGEVRVALKSLGQDLELQVSNTGPGIAPEHLEHVFDRFFRADKARARSEGHTGLGLAITKSIVEAHGGTIQVASEPGARTTFTVRLPQSEALSPNLAHDRSTPG